MAQKKRFNVLFMALIGVMSALVFASNWIQIPIPTAIGSTRFHLGTVMCLLSGLMLGPVAGGLAAGFGSMFYDFTNPLFINEAWITFLTKFCMAWMCGFISWRGVPAARTTAKKVSRNLIAAISGALLYTVLYTAKNFIMYYFLMRMELTPALLTVGQMGLVSVVNGMIGVVAVIPLHTAMMQALGKTDLYRRMMGTRHTGTTEKEERQ